MKLTKAIEILNILHTAGAYRVHPDEIDACKLGIEALKRHENRASLTFSGMLQPLPGETID